MDLSLQEHLSLLGINGDHLAFLAGIPKEVVQRALDGHEIVKPHAESIAYQLSKEHGLQHAVGYSPVDIRGLKVFEPASRVTEEKPNPLRDRLLGK